MKLTYIILLSVLGVILLLCLSLFLGAVISHHKMFGVRYESDKRISFYTKEEFGLQFKEMSVPCGKSLLKGGIYSYPGCKEDTLVVYAHGMWSGVCAYMQDIEAIARRGYRVLALNHEGTDSSTGRNLRGLSNSLRCLDKTLDYLENDAKYKDKGIYVCGHSWGGFAAANITKYHPDVKGILAISPFISVSSCVKGMIPRYLWPVLPFYRLYDFFCCGGYAYASAAKSLKKFVGNIVIIHSENDTMVRFGYNTKVLMDKGIKAHYMIYKDKYHNPHYSYDALRAGGEYLKAMAALQTDEEKAEFMKKTDYHKIGELDFNIMNEAMDYLFKEV